MTEAEAITHLADEDAVAAFAMRLAPVLHEGGTIHLHGDLGAGKTTFARALLRTLGVGERIKSPTYSLIETYRIGDLTAHHLDLYRIADPGELDFLGVSELTVEPALLLVEWPERGGTMLPPPDLLLHFDYATPGRSLRLEARSRRGVEWTQRAGI
jgi:tRNA threonylcarbamoyladenosine biosynthesis protein TsaE